MPSPSERIVYTPQLANQALPLVRRIVDDILRMGPLFRQAELDAREANEVSSPESRALKEELDACFEELSLLGCTYKSWDQELGLVDFPAVIDGGEVCLCWRSDEASVTHYHSNSEGYAGRRRVPSAQCPPA